MMASISHSSQVETIILVAIGEKGEFVKRLLQIPNNPHAPVPDLG